MKPTKLSTNLAAALEESRPHTVFSVIVELDPDADRGSLRSFLGQDEWPFAFVTLSLPKHQLEELAASNAVLSMTLSENISVL